MREQHKEADVHWLEEARTATANRIHDQAAGETENVIQLAPGLSQPTHR